MHDMWNMERIRLTASEEMSFENVDGRTDGRRTPDACIYYKLTYEPSAQVGELKKPLFIDKHVRKNTNPSLL